MIQNASLGDATAGGHDAIVMRTAQRTLARRHAIYADEVRRLLDAGLEVMRQAGTTKSPRVSDIVAAAGLSRDAFYRHFTSKEDLVAAIVEAGAHRLVSYLGHQMGKERKARGQLRRWVEGVMAQATDPEVARSTRAVLWNGRRVGDRSRPEVVTTYGALTGLLVDPLEALGSADPERDAAVICQATMGRMQEFLWQGITPTKTDIEHLVGFCARASGLSAHGTLVPARAALP
jgi:AcrR family transcriptional regulator